MPLYIRDDEVDALAVKLQTLTKAQTKTDAVREALRHELERVMQNLSARARLSKALDMASALGVTKEAARDFDQKAFFDKMWGDS